MKRAYVAFIALMLILSVSAFAQVIAVPNTMQFQARLSRPDGTAVPDGTYSVRFSLHTALTGGTEKWNQTQNVTTKTGNFAVLLTGFPAGTFDGSLFLEMKIGTDAPLTPRQPLASVAYAFKADKVKDGSITSASIANGTITATDLAPNALNPLAWLLNGNSGTNGTQFLGTTDNQPLEFRVNARRAMRYQYVDNPTFDYRSLNVLGGSELNTIDAGVTGAVIAGGGLDYGTGTDSPNRVAADFGTVSGGISNTASGVRASIGGGGFNAASGVNAAISGGNGNTASGTSAAIGGGVLNIASGLLATVPGGFQNTAQGDFSFAAGRHAKANHEGAFVWGDSDLNDFASTGVNQFLIRAKGGVGIGTNAPGNATLHVRGGRTNVAIFGGDRAPVGQTIFESNRTTATNLYHLSLCNNDLEVFYVDGTGRPHGTGSYVNFSDARFKKNVVPIEKALDSILNLRGITFEWDTEKWKERGLPSGRQIGFLAQEVEQVLPELVTTDARGYKMVSYSDAVPVLVEAVKQQQRQMTAQQTQTEAKLAQKDAEVQALKKEVAELKTLVQQLAEQQKAGQK